MPRDNPYVGTELELFAGATTWKRYWHSLVAPFLEGDILEVGAGLGANLSLVRTGVTRRWVCLEPDRTLCQRLQEQVDRLELDRTCRVISGTVDDLANGDVFDAVLYFDVLEHIEDDAGELSKVMVHLRPGGVLVILAPAHPWLYTAFDSAIGHHRRYTKTTLVRAIPRSLNAQLLKYLDSVGLAASVANRLFLRAAIPTARQLLFWDRVLVRLSMVIDPVVGYSVGKSLLGVWRRGTS